MIIERLIKIKKRCEELLAIAAKRTHGAWIATFDSKSFRWQIDVHFTPFSGMNIGRCGPDGGNEAQFIASCAGPAEAGWRATISVIDAYEMILRLQRDSDSMTEVFEHVEYSVDQILAAWPEELL